MRSSRAIAKVRRGFRAALVVLAFAALTAGSTVVAMFATALGSIEGNEWHAVLELSVLFGLFGAMLDAIMALDRSAKPTLLPRLVAVPFNAPRARTIICAVLGVVAVGVVWSWQPERFSLDWVIFGAAVGAALGWWGWRWAKYVDF
jgi:hypothetical protein